MDGRGRGRGIGAGRQGRHGREGDGRNIGRMVERCHGCNRDVLMGTIAQYINKKHNHNGPDPKTAAEMNTAEGGIISRWLECPVEGCGKVCMGENGMNHHRRMHERHDAANNAANNEGNEADAAAENNGADAANDNNNELNNNEAAPANNNGNGGNNNNDNVEHNADAGNNEGPNGGLLGDILRQAGLGENGEIIVIDYGLLLSQTRKGLYIIHHSWIHYMVSIMIALLNMSCEEDQTRQFDGILALMLFPGILTKMMAQGKKKTPTIQQLRAIDGANNKARYIIEQAIYLAEIMPPRAQGNDDESNIERTRSQAEVLFKEGRISACRQKVDELEKKMTHVVPGVRPTEEEYKEMIQRLFPESCDLDVLPSIEEEPEIEELLQINADHIQKKGESMSTDSSAGTTAWSPNIIHKMLDQRRKVGHNGETGPHEIHHAIARLVNKMLKGQICETARDLMVESRLCWVDKKNIPLSRPICMDCAFMRWIYNCSKNDLDKKLMTEIGDIQLGVGERSGTEILGRLLDAAYQEGKTITMLDSINAYGKVKLRGLFYELQRVAPEYLAIYRFQYGGGRKIRDNRGNVVKITKTGVKPGCPLSNNYYALEASRLQRRLASDLKESEEQCREEGRMISSDGFQIGYLDDMYLVNDTRVTATNTLKLSPAFTDHGAELCIPKCIIVGQEVFDHDDVPDGWEISQSGAVAVGVPFGDRKYKREFIKTELIKKYPPRLALSIMSPRLIIALILFSYSKRGGYLINTSNELHDTLPLAEDFDKAMLEAVAAVAQVTVTDVIRAIVNLPQRFSGWGLQEIGGLSAEAGQLSGALKAKAYISENCTPEQIQELTKHINTDIVLGTSQDLCAETGIETVTYDIMTAKTAPKILWKGKDMVQKHKSDMLIVELGERAETRQHAAALLSKGGSGSRYILSSIGRGVENYFPSADYVAVLRNHLGQLVTNNEPRVRTRPQGGAVYDTASNPSEPLVDVLNKRFATMRHTKVKEAVMAAIKKMKPGDYVEPEKEVGSIVTVNEGRPDNVSPVIGDIIWMNGATKEIVEISGIVPEANTYMARWDTYLTPDAACEQTQIKKKVKYAKVNRISGENSTIPADSVTTFVFEASGRLGPEAFSFINRVFETQTYRRSQLISEIALICAKSTGKMLTASRDRYITQSLLGG